MVEAGQSGEELPEQPQKPWKPASQGKCGVREDRAWTSCVTGAGMNTEQRLPFSLSVPEGLLGVGEGEQLPEGKGYAPRMSLRVPVAWPRPPLATRKAPSL